MIDISLSIGMIGAGTWGTALAQLLATNGHQVMMWSHNPKAIEDLKLNRVHKKIPDVELHENIFFTSELKDSVVEKDFIVIAVPSIHVRKVVSLVSPYVKENQIIVNVSKGIEEATLLTISEQIEEEVPQAVVAVLSGPSHAEEVIRGFPTTCVVASKNEDILKGIQDAFMSDVFRVYRNTDIIGVEIGGALKNVIALAAGISDGLGYGDNAKAALITRGIAEISRLGVRMGGKLETFGGLTGIGDLIVTCSSLHSRNRKAGFLIGQGKNLQEAVDEVGMVVEGVNSAKAALELAKKYNESMPIVEEVNAILFNFKDAKQAVNDLMTRDGRLEYKKQ